MNLDRTKVKVSSNRLLLMTLVFMVLTAGSALASWQRGFDFRNTANFVTDPSGDTYVLSTTAYPTNRNGVTFGWVKTSLITGRDRNASLDPRLAGMDFANNGAPAIFVVDLPSAGTYNLSLALGDAGYQQCWVLCQVQFFDGNTLLATVSGGSIPLGYFYDAQGSKWSASAWPANNLSQQVTLTGTRLTVVVGTSKSTGDATPIAFLGITQASGSPNFSISASPSSLSVTQGNQGTSTITTTVSGGFNSSISLSASGVPSGTTVSFNPNPIPAPGSGNSTMTITVGSSTPTGTYPITVTGSGSGIQRKTTVTLTVTAPQPDFTISASPSSLSIPQGDQGTSTITTTVLGGFNNAVSLSTSGVPSGTSVSFDPNPIPAPGAGNSTMTVTVGASTAVGTYPITVTGKGGSIQHNTTVMLTVTAASAWQQGFDFRDTANYVTDPSGDTYVLPTTVYPTQRNGVTFGWEKTSLVGGRDRTRNVDPRLAGINFASNGAPATFDVDLPSPGTYNLSLALGDAGYQQCWVQCQVQFFDGSTLLATVSGGTIALGYFYDAQGNKWSSSAWATSNVPQLVTLQGTRLTMSVGTNHSTGDNTTVAFLGVTQATGAPYFTISASPSSIGIAQGNQGTSTITTTISGGFNSAISLSASGMPSDTTISFNPQTIPAPGAGNSTMTITVGSDTPPGTYPITVTGNGGGIQQHTTVMLTVTSLPTFTISASPSSLSIAEGNQGTSTITSTISGGFDSAVSLSASGMPSGVTVGFNPNPIPAPGSGNSTMTITVASGTATGTYPLTVTGSGGGIQQNATVTLTVTSGGSGQPPPTAYYSQPYVYTLQSSFGTPPYTYQLISGTLPPGLTIDQSGDITGTPTTPGQYPFEVQVTDSSSPPKQQTFDYTISVLTAVVTYHNDNYRSGGNTNETLLTPSNVKVQTFGKRSVFSVQGYVYAQPLYVPGVNISGVLHNVLYVVTEHDQAYAFDVNSGQQLWQANFLASSGNITISSVSSGDVSCNDMVPEIGITGTPVIDTSTGTLYLVTKTKEYNSQTKQTTFYQTLHALDITTGADKVAPQRITAQTQGTGDGSSGGILTFDPLKEGQRSALLLQKGQVFIAWSSHCDNNPYHGYIMAYDEATLAQNGVFVTSPNGYRGGFWSSGAGPAADAGGAIYHPTGNGDFTANNGGLDYGDTVLRLAWSSSGKSFSVADYFTPWDQHQLDNNDNDVGSGGVMLLPNQPGTTYPHLLLMAGKKGDIYLISRDNMGHWNPNGNDNQIVQSLPNAVGGVWGAPAFWNDNIYFGGIGDHLKAFAFDPVAQLISSSPTSSSPQSFGYPGPTPSVSSNGNTNAIVWIAQDDGYSSGKAILHAYDATNLSKELYNSSQNSSRDSAGLAAKFTVPTVADGLVFVGTLNEVDMYGPLP